MRGDYSRLRFRPENHYSAVRLQQGRVLIDADYNEGEEIAAHRDAETTVDTIGRTGFPLEGGGFAISPGMSLRAIAELDEVRWVVGDGATLVRWRDGEWQAAAEAPEGVGRLNAVDLRTASPDLGMAVGDGGVVLRIDDGPWELVETKLALGDLHAVRLTADDEGWIAGDDATLVHFKAKTFKLVHAGEVTRALRGLAFLDAERGIAVGDGGAIAITRDAKKWSRVASLPAGVGDLHAVAAGVLGDGAELVVAVGAGGTILASLDGGKKWTRESVPRHITATLRGVELGEDRVIAVGDDGTILVRDSGGTWHPAALQEEIHPPLVEHLRAVAVGFGGPVAVGDNVALETVCGGWGRREIPTAARNLAISAGDGYVDGLRVVNDRPVTYTTQPYTPGTLEGLGEGFYAVVLRVAQHHLTAVDRDELREIALGGPDSTTRTQTVWGVELKPVGSASCVSAAATIPTAGDGRLRARAVPGEEPVNECAVAENGGFRRLENQLYRVEILSSAQTDDETFGTFTWSRENGSVSARLVGFDAEKKAVTIEAPERDPALSITADDYIEVTDERRSMRGERGLVLEVTFVRGDVIEFEYLSEDDAAVAWTLGDFPLHPVVRRWEGVEPVRLGEWTALEAGVEVEFAGQSFRPCDYWTIPARTLSSDVDWPRAGAVARFEPPAEAGVGHAVLAVAERAADGIWTVKDCRRRFPPLTQMTRFSYLGGDGQEVLLDPDTPTKPTLLPHPLLVGVTNGSAPVEGAAVRFRRMDDGGGKLAGPDADVKETDANGNAIEIELRTDEQGVARCEWSTAAPTGAYRVRARLVSEVENHPPIWFSATRNVAEQVTYDPGSCDALEGAGTVQEAVDRLARQRRLHHISGNGLEVVPGTTIELSVGVSSACRPREKGNVKFALEGPGGSVSPDTAQAVQGVATTKLTATKPGLHVVTATLANADAPPLVITVTARPAERGVCTVIVRAGESLQEAVNQLPESGGELCLGAGTFEVDVPVEIKRNRILVSGRGPATVVRSKRGGCALRFTECTDVTVRDLRVEGGDERQSELPDGALTFLGGTDLRVADCQLASGGGFEAHHACLVVRSTDPDRATGPFVEVDRCRLEVASWQAGVLVDSATRTVVRRCDIRLRAATAREIRGELGELTDVLVRSIVASQAGPRVVRARTFTFDGSQERFVFAERSPLIPLVEDFASTAGREVGRRGLQVTLGEYLGRAGRGEVPEPARQALDKQLATLDGIGRAIAVTGRAARVVRIVDNLVQAAIAGIQVQASQDNGSAGDVVVARNHVECQVPNVWEGTRGAVEVAGADRVTVSDLDATLDRTGPQPERGPVPVNGVEVSGSIGPYMVVRQCALARFPTPVRIEPSNVPEVRMWMVAETVSTDGGGTAVFDPVAVIHDNNFPVP